MFQKTKITPRKRVLYQRSKMLVGLLVFGVFLFAAFFSLFTPQKANATAPANLNFQARLMTASGAIVPDGNYNIEFKLYNASSSSGSSQGSCTGDAACLWTETRTSGNVVQVKNGYLTVNLGSVTGFGGVDFSQQLWMTMRVGGTGAPSWDPEMNPRLQLTAVPYAFKAGDSATLGGLSSSQFIQNTTTLQTGASLAIQSAADANVTAYLQGRTTQSAATLLIKQGSSQSGEPLKIQDSGGTTMFQIDQFGSAYVSNQLAVDKAVGFGTSASSGVQLRIQSANNSSIGLEVNSANPGQTANVAQLYGPTGRSLVYDAAGTLNIQGGTSQTTPLAAVYSGNTSGTITNNLLVNRDVAGGITTNGIAITQTAGTLTNGLSFSGTIGTDIQRISGALSLNGASGINLQSNGTTTASLSSTGAASFQNSSDSATGFQVKKSSGAGGATVLDVDTSNGRVGIGTVSPTATLHAAVNTSATASPIGLFQQSGTGDSTLELKNAGSTSSFYLSNDASSGNTFTLNSNTAATSGGQATITPVQNNFSNSSLTATSITQAFGSNNAAGNLIVATISWDNTNTSTAACSDSQGNAYSQAVIQLDNTNHDAVMICYAANIAAGANSVTATFGGNAGSRFISIHEYSGAATSNPLDVVSSNLAAGTTTTDNITSGSATTTQAGDLVVGGVIETSGTTSITPGTGFTQRGTVNSVALDEDFIKSTQGSVAATATFGTARTYIAAMATFKAGITAGSLTDTSTNALFTLSQTGAAKFKNLTNSTNALQVQNAAGTNVLAVDTSNSVLQLLGSTLVKAPTNSQNALQVQNSAGTTLSNINSIAAGTGNSVAAGSNAGGSLSGSAATTYYYKITGITPSGESVPSPEVSISGSSFTTLSAPTALTAAASATAGSVTCNNTAGQGCKYEVTYVTANGETTAGTASTSLLNVTSKQINLTGIPLGATGTIARNIYRSTNNGSYLFVQQIANNTSTTATDNVATANAGGSPPAVNGARTNTNNASITFGSVTGATSYRVYRGTAAGAETAYQTTAASPFTDTGAAGTAGTGRVATSTISGTELVQPAIDSVATWQVMNAAGTATVANVDTVNQRFGINTPSATGNFQVNQNNLTPGTVTNSASSANVTGSGTTFTTTFQEGDTFTITSSGNSCTVASITSDTALTCTATLAGSSAGSAYSFTQQARLTVANNGATTIGGELVLANATQTRSFGLLTSPTNNKLQVVSNVIGNTGNNSGLTVDSGNMNFITSSKYDSGPGGQINTIYVYFPTVDSSPNNHAKVAVYTDNAGNPGTLLSSPNAPSTVVTSSTWSPVSLGTTITLAPHTTYWLGFSVDSNTTTYAYSPGAVNDSSYMVFSPTSPLPATWSTGAAQSSDDYSIYAPYISVTSPDSGKGTISVSDNGNALFKPLYNDSDSFEIQTASGSTMFIVNSAVGTSSFGGSVNLNTGNDTSAALVGYNSGNQVVSSLTQQLTSDTLQTNTTNTSGTQTNGILYNRNGAGGTTTNGVNITNAAGTLTNGLSFSGTIGTDINRGSGTLSLAGAGGVSITSSAGNIVLGTVDANTTLLILDNSSAASDPTGINGAMYYSTSKNQFRCYGSGAWTSCGGGVLSASTSASGNVGSCTTNCAAMGVNGALPANYCQAGRVIHLLVDGLYENNATTNMQYDIYFGTSTTKASDTLLNGATNNGPSSIPTTSSGFYGWHLDATIVCNSTTSMTTSGTVSIANGPGTSGVIIFNPTTVTGLTTTSAKNFYIFPTYSTNSATTTSNIQTFTMTGM